MKSKSGQQITGRLKSKVNGRCSVLTTRSLRCTECAIVGYLLPLNAALGL